MKGGGTPADGGNLTQDAKEDKKKAKKKHHHRKHDDETAKADSSHKHKHHHHHAEDASAETPPKHKHHKHHKEPVDPASIPKPAGVAPIPPTLSARIVQELHRENKPSPRTAESLEKTHSPKVTPPAIPTPAAPLGLLATIRQWLNEKILHPLFSRQRKITHAYSSSFSRTLKAIEKRFSANDSEHPEGSAMLGKKPPLRFKGAIVEKTTRPAAAIVDLSANTKPNKPTLH
ncbi:MAG: hypothetical protein AB7I18_06445 [Candidatus Berkiella sp.]